MDLFDKLKTITGSAAEPLMDLINMPEKEFAKIKDELIKVTGEALFGKTFRENLKNNFDILGTKTSDTTEVIGFINDLILEVEATEMLTPQKKEFTKSFLSFIRLFSQYMTFS